MTAIRSSERLPLSLPLLSGEPREQRGTSARGGRRAKNLPEPSSISMAGCQDSISRGRNLDQRYFFSLTRVLLFLSPRGFSSSYPVCRGEWWSVDEEEAWRGSETTRGAGCACVNGRCENSRTALPHHGTTKTGGAIERKESATRSAR